MLVSVKNLNEARIALAIDGVSIIDVKDPSGGSLGLAPANTINEIAAEVAGRSVADPKVADHRVADQKFVVQSGADQGDALPGNADDKGQPWDQTSLIRQSLTRNPLTRNTPVRKTLVSVAMGELAQHQTKHSDRIAWDHIDFVKFGLAGMYHNGHWRRPLLAAFSRIPDRVRKVLVLYVDQVDLHTAAAMLDATQDCGTNASANILASISVVLLDTFDKTNGSAFSHWSGGDCQSLFQMAKSRDMATVMAGSINEQHLSDVQRTQADTVGVRGAVCDGPREGRLSAKRLESFITQCGHRFAFPNNDLAMGHYNNTTAIVGPS